MESVKGKVVLITGASSGIGAAAAVLFAKYGSKLVLTGRNEENLNKTAEKCISQGLNKDQVCVVTGDISKDEDLVRIVDTAVSTFGTINVLVNNAAHTFPSTLLDTSMENFDETYRVVLRAAVSLTKLVVPYLKKNKGSIVNIASVTACSPIPKIGCYSVMKAALSMVTKDLSLGSIVNIASVTACSPIPKIGCYSVMKAALSMVTKDLSLELASDGVRVNEIIPGHIRTPMIEQFSGDEGLDEYCATLGSVYPFGRVGLPEEIAQGIVFMASDASTFTSGASLKIEGAVLNTASWHPLAL